MQQQTCRLKAQASVEQLIMIGIGLAILGMLAYISSTLASDNANAVLAKYAVEKLANTADLINSMDIGSKTTVDLYVPKNVLLFNTTGNRIVMQVGLSTGPVDFFANTKANMIGSVSTSEGRTLITVEKLADNKIMIGDNFLSCTPLRIPITLIQGETKTTSSTVSNVGSLQITGIQGNVHSSIADMVTVSGVQNTLNSGESFDISIIIMAPTNKQPGAYSGAITINGTPTSECTTILDIVVTSATGPDTQGPIASAPIYTPTNPTHEEDIIAYSTCDDTTTGGSNIQNAELEIDYSGIWNNMNPKSGSYGTSPTLDVEYDVGTLTGGTHYLSVRCTDSEGNIGSSSTTMLYVDGPIADNTGPVVYSLTHSPVYVSTANTVIVNATGDDRNTGNTNVSSCQIELDQSNIWNIMIPIGGSYGSSPLLNLGYTLGTLSEGDHIVRVRCMDVYGNVGAAAIDSFTVYPPDTQGPVISYLSYSPANPTTTDRITITVTANDSGRGNSPIAGCELKQNSHDWIPMMPSGNSNTTPVQNYSLNLGMLTAGTHNISVKCTDSQMNTGPSTSITIPVKREILFIHYGSSGPNTAESYWVNWINRYNSHEGFPWKMDLVHYNNVNDSIYDYKIVVIAYSLNNQNDKWTYINYVIPYKNTGHYVVLLGQALQYGLGKLSISGSGGSSSTTNIKIKSNHYITSGYNIDSLQQVTSSSANIYYATGTNMLNIAENPSASGRGTILEGSNVITYGVYRPDYNTAVGNIIASRVLDYAIMNSD